MDLFCDRGWDWDEMSEAELDRGKNENEVT